MEMKLHIDFIDIVLYLLVVLAFLVSWYSKEKNKKDLKEQSYSIKYFWKWYNDDFFKVLILCFIAMLIKDEIAMPLIEYFYPEFIDKIEGYNLNYSLTVIVCIIVGKFRNKII